MALFNESLQGRFQRLIQRTHSMKGGSPAPQVAPEILHVIVLENDRPETMYLGDVHRYMRGLVLAASVGNPSTIRFRNPTASGILSVVEFVFFDASAAGEVDMFLGTVNADLLVGSVRGLGIDSRHGAASSACTLSSGNVSGSGTQIFNQDEPITTTTALTIPFTLAPGASLDIQAPGLNVGLKVSIVFRERALDASET